MMWPFSSNKKKKCKHKISRKYDEFYYESSWGHLSRNSAFGKKRLLIRVPTRVILNGWINGSQIGVRFAFNVIFQEAQTALGKI